MNYKIVPLEIRHAAALAVMWNESMSAWPFGFGGGTEFNEQRILDWIKEDNAISVDIALADDGRVLGYCQMIRYPRELDAAYISLLNVHPEHHGAKIGKALLKKAVEHAVALKVRRLDLNTWPANMKAVPLYKKCGFFWVPETTVYMQNYLPLIMQQGPARDFFSRHDWYGTFERGLEVIDDEQSWQGTKSFRYTWRSGTEYLDVVVDRESRGITAMETDEWAVSCRLSDAAPATGMTHQVFWEVENKSGDELPVYLRSSGTSEIPFEEEWSGPLTGKREHSANLNLAADVRPKGNDEAADRLRSLIVIGPHAVSLETGIRARQPVTVSLYPEVLPPYTGRPVSGYIRLKNNLDRPVRGTVQIVAGPGLNVDCLDASFSAGPKEQAGVPVVFRVSGPGAYHAYVSARYEEDGAFLTTRVQSLPVMLVPVGGAAATQEDEFGLLETERLSIRTYQKGGRTTVSDRITGTQTVFMPVESLGPPFWPNEFEALEADVKAEGECLRTVIRSKDRPGLVLEKTISAGGGPLVTLEYRVYNYGTAPAELQLQAMANITGMGRLALPLAEGLVVEEIISGDLPGEEDISKNPEAWAETWCSLDGDGRAAGFIWQGPVKETPYVPWMNMVIPVLDFGTVMPGDSVQLPPLYLYLGEGGYRAVRRYWSALTGGDRPEMPRSRRLTEATFGGPLLCHGAESPAVLTVSNPRAKTVSGTLTLVMPAGWQSSEEAAHLDGIGREKAFSREIRIRRTATTPDAGRGVMRLESRAGTTEYPFCCIGVGDGTQAKVEKQSDGTWRVNNGPLGFKVDPAFSGSCFALEAGGHNHLFSAYPTPGTFKAMKPWYGGIFPGIFGERGGVQLYRDTFVAEEVSRVGRSGWTWRGVRTSVKSGRKDLEGLVAATTFLTLGGSNILAVIASLTNPFTVPVRVSAGASNFLQAGGDVKQALLHYERNGRMESRNRHAGYAEVQAKWAAVENAENGWTVLGLSPNGQFWVTDRTDCGAHLLFQNDLVVGPGETAERIYYLVILESFDQYAPYLSLMEIPELF